MTVGGVIPHSVRLVGFPTLAQSRADARTRRRMELTATRAAAESVVEPDPWFLTPRADVDTAWVAGVALLGLKALFLSQRWRALVELGASFEVRSLDARRTAKHHVGIAHWSVE